MKRLLALVILATVLVMSPLGAAEIQYVESFALSPDRAAILQQLIPGTEDHFYYYSLHYQHSQQFDKVDQLLQPWVQQYGLTERAREIMHRQALLTYNANPQKSLDYLIRTLDLRFDQQRLTRDRPPDLPTTLDPNTFSRDTLLARAMSSYANLQGFEEAALDWLMGKELSVDHRRDLLRRLTRPDYPQIVDAIVADLQAGAGFGDYPIHFQLLLAQLDELAKRIPNLLSNANFVNAYLVKLRPSAGVDWASDPAERKAYLDRQWSFVQKLPPAFNSLKAHVLYHILVHQRSQGEYDRELLLEYLQLPRSVSYINPDFLQRHIPAGTVADLNASYDQQTLLPPIGDDELLVRAYLQHFFVEDTTYQPFVPYVREEYLRRVFAETKIVNGLGNAEQWFTWLSPADIQALKERVDIDFAPTNKSVFGVDDPVRLDVYVKNVSTLIVKVFEINTTNYYRETNTDINTDVNLDGLTPNWEYTFNYNEPPVRRVRRQFEFAELSRRGVYVIDFIGNGRSSRALVRKGKLRFVTRHSTAGQIFNVLDEQNRPLTDAEIQLGGQHYSSNEKGEIVLPYSTAPGQQPIILIHDGFATLEHFFHSSESYQLTAGIYVDREALLRSRKATLIVRPALYLNGVPVTLSVLKNVRLKIISTDLDGIQSTVDVKDFALFEDRESTHEILVPPRLSQLHVQLTAEVQSLSENKKLDLVTSASFGLNQIDTTHSIEDVYLSKATDGYWLEVLGRTGELKIDRPVSLQLKHRDFTDVVPVLLKSDADGRVHLGELPQITAITAALPDGVSHSWNLATDRQSYSNAVHGRVGQKLELPYPKEIGEAPLRELFSLLELRDGSFSVDRLSSLTVEDGALHITGLGAGDYNLLLKREAQSIHIRIAAGEQWERYVLGPNRLLEVRNAAPVRIATVETTDTEVRIALRNATKFTRVHVLATRYLPEYNEFERFGAVRDADPQWSFFPTSSSAYIEGRNIGDEYRYIIDRRYAEKFPGNTLARPALLLNPWPVRDTQTSTQEAAPGADFAARSDEAPAAMAPEGSAPGGAAALTGFSNYDWLAHSAEVLANLEPDENGALVIPRSVLANHHYLRIVVLDPLSTASRELTLPQSPREILDLRLVKVLDPAKHYLQQQQVTKALKGDQFILEDVVSSRFEATDSLLKVFTVFSTLSSDPKLAEFRFLLDWSTYDAKKKSELYSEFACHELHFYLYQKDRPFFEQTIRPYLRNKREKQFMDHWLLEDDLRSYTDPWQYARLNTLERILLAQRLEELSLITKEIADQLELQPIDVARLNQLFETVTSSASMDSLSAITSETAARDMEDVQAAGGAMAGGLGGLGMERKKELGIPAQENLAKAQAAQNEARLSMRFRRQASDRDNRGFGAFYPADTGLRAAQLFQPLDKTKEWAESNYYHLPLEQQAPQLVPVNRFWLEYAKSGSEDLFLSQHYPEAGSSFAEMMFVLALLDLPEKSPEHELKFEESKMTMVAAGPALAFHQELLESPVAEEATALLVSQNFFRQSDRYQVVAGQQVDKFVLKEFLVHTEYGCQVVVTNPTSATQQVEVLVQIPEGALPLAGSRYTRSVRLQLGPYATQTVEYFFYFPQAGKYRHYPVHVGKDGKVLASSEAFTFNVVDKLSDIDRTSWDYVSQQGTNEEVLTFLRERNLFQVDLSRIAWRMREVEFFKQVIAELTRRHAYNHVLWSYSVKHNLPAFIRSFLEHADTFVAQAGAYLDSPLLLIDPVERYSYEHLEYKPLVNARTHRLGEDRQILNDRFYYQYHRLMAILACRRALDDNDLMAVTYYMLLQDRIADAQQFFARVNAENLKTRLQYDYFAAYLDFFHDDPTKARAIVKQYADYPVERWRKAFAVIAEQLAEIDGGRSGVIDPLDRDQVQSQLAAMSPTLEIQLEGRTLVITYQNLKELRLNFYEMDVELLFSRNPFVQQFSGQFSYIRPNVTDTVTLPGDQTRITIPLPEKLQNRNVLIEALGGGQTRTRTYYSNSMDVQLSDNYGQVRVLDANSRKPLSKVYVKVYARMQDGNIRFYKDGYTDLRGRFDYASLSTNELDYVEKFSLLVLSDEQGAVVRETDPPKR